jgi:protein-S-isoprenylcysteine O-methyltransferase Ste14
MTAQAEAGYTATQRRAAAAWGILCHVSFAAGVCAMMAGLYTGMMMGLGGLHGAWAILGDFLLLAQFPLAHSLLLSTRGRRWLSHLAPLGLGNALGTTTYATIASWQLLATFVLWSPLGQPWWTPRGATLAALSIAYGGAWLLLLKTMTDAGLAVQTGYLGWGAVVRGRSPAYGPFRPRGTFRWVRQPVYVAFALTLWTAPVWTVDHLVLAATWTAYCVLAPRNKERRYLRAHGEQFERYRQLVPYWVPNTRPVDLGHLLEDVDVPSDARVAERNSLSPGTRVTGGR